MSKLNIISSDFRWNLQKGFRVECDTCENIIERSQRTITAKINNPEYKISCFDCKKKNSKIKRDEKLSTVKAEKDL